MPKLPRVTARQTLRALQRAGWYRHRQRGSHLVLKHAEKAGGRIVLPMHSGETLHPKTLAGILEEAGITNDEFRELM